MGRSVRVQGAALPHRRLRDAHFLAHRLDNHLAGTLHPGRLKPQGAHALGAKPPQPALKVAHGSGKQQPPDAGEDGIPHIPAQERHPLGTGFAGEAVADDDVAAVLQRLPERIERAQVVLAVAIPQNDEMAARGVDAADDGVSVASPRLLHHPRAHRLGAGGRAVAAAVVQHDHFAGDGAPVQELPRLADAVGDGAFLVAAEDENGQRWDIGHQTRSATTA